MIDKRTRTANVYITRTDSSLDLVDISTTCISRENRISVKYLLNGLREDALRWIQEECRSYLERLMGHARSEGDMNWVGRATRTCSIGRQFGHARSAYCNIAKARTLSVSS